MKWIQIKESLPKPNEAVILAKKSLYVRPSQENKCSFYSVCLIHPSQYYSEFDKSLYLWCKADLHLDQKHEFNLTKYFEEKSQAHIGESEKTYMKVTSLDWWLALQDPEPKVDFDIN